MHTTTGRLGEIWTTLSERQKKYVLARQHHRTKKDAAKAIGVLPQTVYTWPPEVEEAAILYLDNAAEAAMAELSQALAKAAMGKVREMDSTDEHLAARARTEVLDRGLGKPVARQETTVDGRFDVTSERLDELTTLLAQRAAAFAEDNDTSVMCDHCAGDCTGECGAEA